MERGATRVHEEDGVGGREGGGDVAGLEEELVELPAGGGAAGAEELDAGGDVDGHGSSSNVGKPERTGSREMQLSNAVATQVAGTSTTAVLSSATGGRSQTSASGR